jgi:NAD-dependent deacetylase
VRDPLRVGLGEAHADLGREAVPVHGSYYRDETRSASSTTSPTASFAYNSGIPAEHLARLIVEAQPCVVLTGAGVSTESGIPDFRSRTGIWARYDPMEYATIDAFRRDPAKVWDFYAKRLDVLADARPNAAHLALAELERRGLVEAVVTQNVDRLHQAAGSRRVLEVHGSIRSARCLECGRRERFERVVELLPVPACARCGAVLKPDVVMFGELLPSRAMDQASWLAQAAGLLLGVGSSLEVYPVAGLPEEALQAGGRLAIVNRGSTPYDRRADLKIDASAAETLAAAVDLLDGPVPGT